jgi:hypothetical protein
MGALEVAQAIVPPGQIAVTVVARLGAEVEIEKTIVADLSNDVSLGARGGWTGHSIGPQDDVLRTYVRFALAGIPPGARIVRAVLTLHCVYTQGVQSDLFLIGPYGGDGLTDPAAGTPAQAFERAGLAARIYVADTTLRTVGMKRFEFAGSALADIQRGVSSGRFAFALRVENDATLNHFAAVDGYTLPTAPTLILTYR